MSTLFAYSLVVLVMVLVLGRNLTGRTQLLLSLIMLILLNAPIYLVQLFQT